MRARSNEAEGPVVEGRRVVSQGDQLNNLWNQFLDCSSFVFMVVVFHNFLCPSFYGEAFLHYP